MRDTVDILDRAFALMITADRGLLEKASHNAGTYSTHAREDKKEYFYSVVEERGLEPSLTPFESHVLTATVGSLENEAFEETQWAYEAIPALLWCLSLANKPLFSILPINEDFHPSIAEHRKPGSEGLSVAPVPQREVEIARAEARLWHWRAREGVGNRAFESLDVRGRVVDIFGVEAQHVLDSDNNHWFDGRDFLVEDRRFNELSRADGGRLLLKATYIRRAYEWVLSFSPWDEVLCDT